MNDNGLLLPLDPDAVDLPEYHIFDPAARGLSDKDADTVILCVASAAREEQQEAWVAKASAT